MQIKLGGTPWRNPVVVNTINELSDLSRKLNQKSDKINDIIKKVNQKLAALNFGVEVWLESDMYGAYDMHDLEKDTFRKVYSGQPATLPHEKTVTYLGYCKVEEEWQLATKTATLIEDYDPENQPQTLTELTDAQYTPLAKESRKIRVEALPLIPDLLDKVKAKAESLIKSIDAADKAAEEL